MNMLLNLNDPSKEDAVRDSELPRCYWSPKSLRGTFFLPSVAGQCNPVAILTWLPKRISIWLPSPLLILFCFLMGILISWATAYIATEVNMLIKPLLPVLQNYCVKFPYLKQGSTDLREHHRISELSWALVLPIGL